MPMWFSVARNVDAHPRPRKARLGLLAATFAGALALAACEHGITTFRSEASGWPTEQYNAPYAALNGTNLAIVRDNPFPADKGNEAVLAVMRVNNPMRMYRFALAPTPDWNGYSVILGFGESPVGNQNLCQNPALPLRPTPVGRTSLIADLCYGPLMITEVYGHTDVVGGPDDPRLAALVGGVLEDLLALKTRQHPHLAFPIVVP